MFEKPGSSPISPCALLLPCTHNLTSGRRFPMNAPIFRFRRRAQEETILEDGDICHGWRRFVRLDSPELIRPRRNSKTASGSL